MVDAVNFLLNQMLSSRNRKCPRLRFTNLYYYTPEFLDLIKLVYQPENDWHNFYKESIPEEEPIKSAEDLAKEAHNRL